MLYGYTKSNYPVEAVCIERKPRDGIYTPPEEYTRLKAAASTEGHAAHQAETAAMEQRKASELVAWLAAGGLA